MLETLRNFVKVRFEARIAELDQARNALERLVGKCTSGKTGPCPILSSFGI